MEGFVFSGQMVPGMGRNASLTATNRYTGKKFGESNFSGGDAGLQYRFWNPAENNYSSADIDDDKEASSEEANFMEHIFKCKDKCKSDLGGYSTMRDCVRACKSNKGKVETITPVQPVVKVIESSYDPTELPKSKVGVGSNKSLWIVIVLLVAIIIGLLIYFKTKNKSGVISE